MIDVLGFEDGGWDALPAVGRELLLRADVVVGGRRHLDMLPPQVTADRRPWPKPLRHNLERFVGELPEAAVVLASGDPLLSGVGTTLIDALGAEQVRIHPAVSSETLARAWMGWPAETTDVITVVGRSTDRVVPFLTPGAHLVVLCSDGGTPAELADLATRHGAGGSTLTALWHLGGASEGSRSSRCDAWGDARTPDLVVACLDVTTEADPQRLGPAPGRADASFDHDGLITKRAVRATALAHLRPTPGALLWDVGAGSGAVAIEWALAAPRASSVAVERDTTRAQRITANATTLGVAHRVSIVAGEAADVVLQLADSTGPPDAVFLGGGVSRDVIDHVLAQLAPGGRLVAHAVTLETESLLLEAHAEHGGDVTRLAVEHLEPLGRFTSWKPARAVVQWSLTLTEPGDRS